MSEWAQLLPLLGATGVAGWAGNASLQWFKARADRQQASVTSAVDLEKHSDQLMFDVLAASRTEITAARVELEELRPLRTKYALIEARLAHFDEALSHLQSLLETRTPEDRAQAERLARAFVNRMRRIGEAQSTMANEAQRIASAEALRAEASDLLGTIPPAS